VVITSGLQHPESVIVHGNFIYVTNLGKDTGPIEKDGDGTIVKLDRSGKVLDAAFNKSPLNAPKGTAIVGNTLYVADIDRIVGFDLSSGKRTDVIDFTAMNAKLLNDIAVKGDSVLFVSDTNQGKIYRVSLGTPRRMKALDIPTLKPPNGVAYDSKTNTLYVGCIEFSSSSTSELGKITWKGRHPTYSRLIELKDIYDGLVLTDDHTLILSTWTSWALEDANLIRVDLRTLTHTVLSQHTIAADITYDQAGKRLLLPGLTTGKVMEYKIK